MCKNESFWISLNIGWVFWIKEKRCDYIKFVKPEKWTRIEKTILINFEAIISLKMKVELIL
jgi:hypothetical protein